MDDVFGVLGQYKPEKIQDGFGIIKGTFACRFNSFRIEAYDGDFQDLVGTEVVRYELEIITEGDNLGRRLWKRFYLGSQKPDGKGKLDIQKLADVLFTLGFEFKTRDELMAVLEKAAELVVEVKAWGWTPKDKESGLDKEPVQQHIIKGVATDKQVADSKNVPF